MCEFKSRPLRHGEMSERLKEPALKSGEAKASVGSNPTLSAIWQDAVMAASRSRKPMGSRRPLWVRVPLLSPENIRNVFPEVPAFCAVGADERV